MDGIRKQSRRDSVNDNSQLLVNLSQYSDEDNEETLFVSTKDKGKNNWLKNGACNGTESEVVALNDRKIENNGSRDVKDGSGEVKSSEKEEYPVGFRVIERRKDAFRMRTLSIPSKAVFRDNVIMNEINLATSNSSASGEEEEGRKLIKNSRYHRFAEASSKVDFRGYDLMSEMSVSSPNGRRYKRLRQRKELNRRRERIEPRKVNRWASIPFCSCCSSEDSVLLGTTNSYNYCSLFSLVCILVFVILLAASLVTLTSKLDDLSWKFNNVKATFDSAKSSFTSKYADKANVTDQLKWLKANFLSLNETMILALQKPSIGKSENEDNSVVSGLQKQLENLKLSLATLGSQLNDLSTKYELVIKRLPSKDSTTTKV